jgi:small subunit ribosomal protein S20
MTRAEKFSSAGELGPAQEAVVAAISSIDKAVKKGVIHKNKGARLKSRLARRLNALPKEAGSSVS